MLKFASSWRFHSPLCWCFLCFITMFRGVITITYNIQAVNASLVASFLDCEVLILSKGGGYVESSWRFPLSGLQTARSPRKKEKKKSNIFFVGFKTSKPLRKYRDYKLFLVDTTADLLNEGSRVRMRYKSHYKQQDKFIRALRKRPLLTFSLRASNSPSWPSTEVFWT